MHFILRLRINNFKVLNFHETDTTSFTLEIKVDESILFKNKKISIRKQYNARDLDSQDKSNGRAYN